MPFVISSVAVSFTTNTVKPSSVKVDTIREMEDVLPPEGPPVSTTRYTLRLFELCQDMMDTFLSPEAHIRTLIAFAYGMAN